MKAGKKLLATLLSAACVTAGAFGLTACSGNKDEQTNGEIYGVYQTYVAYAESKGDEVLSYEDWLASIKGAPGVKGEDGKQGETGERGPQGDKGDKGDDGTTWLTGADDPAETSGKVGDLYLNVTSCDIFKKTADGWDKIGNIKGDKGLQGDRGPQGTPGSDGEDGSAGSKGETGETGPAGLGIKDIEIKYDTDKEGNQITVYTFIMTDGSKIVKEVKVPKQIYGVSINSGAPMLWLTSDINEGRYNLSGIFWYIEYSDHTYESISVTADQIDIKTIAEAGLCDVTAKFGNYTGTFGVYIADSADDIEFERSFIDIGGEVYCKKGEQPDFGKAGIFSIGRVYGEDFGETEIVYYRPVTVGMLEGFDSSECGMRDYSIEGVDGSITVCVYADSTKSINFNVKENFVRAVDSGIPELYFDIIKETRLLDDNGDQIGVSSKVIEENVKLTAEMISGSVDFTTVGEKTFAVNSNGNEGKISVTVYDPEVTIVRYMGLNGIGQITVSANTGNDEIASQLVGQSMFIQYFEEVNGSYEDQTEVTEEMLDFSNLDTSAPGMSYVTVTYKGYSLKIYVTVSADWSEAQLTSTLTGNVMVLAFEEVPVTKIELYDNGYAKLYASVEGEEVLLNEMLGADMGYAENNGILTLNYFGSPIMSVVVEDGVFTAYRNESGIEYTGENITVTIYGNGCGIAVLDGMEGEFIISYNVDGIAEGKLYIYPYVEEGGGYFFEFTIDGNKLINDMNH